MALSRVSFWSVTFLSLCRSGECRYAECHGAVLKPFHLVGAGHVGEPLEVQLASLAALLLEPGLKVGSQGWARLETGNLNLENYHIGF